MCDVRKCVILCSRKVISLNMLAVVVGGGGKERTTEERTNEREKERENVNAGYYFRTLSTFELFAADEFV